MFIFLVVWTFLVLCAGVRWSQHSSSNGFKGFLNMVEIKLSRVVNKFKGS